MSDAPSTIEAPDLTGPNGALAAALPAGAPAPALAADAHPSGPRWRSAGRRVAFWTPVIVPMVLFAQVSFLGLRPALSEQRRLAAAELALRERHARDVALAQEIQAHLRARQDPVFLERQRRLRELPPDALRTTP